MVSVVKETKGNAHFYYIRHHSGATEKKRYLGKTIPKNIEQLKSDFMLEFYHDEWNPKIQEIYKNYQKKSKSTPDSIKFKNFESFGIAFTYNTQRIEGSSLTKSDTKDLLIFGVTPAKKQQSDVIETKKHYDLFMQLVSSEKIPITQDMILLWHKEIFGQTKIGEAGHIRQHSVGIITNEKITFTSVPEIPKRLEEFFFWINKYDKKENGTEPKKFPENEIASGNRLGEDEIDGFPFYFAKQKLASYEYHRDDSKDFHHRQSEIGYDLV